MSDMKPRARRKKHPLFTSRTVIGVVHLQPLPGSPAFEGEPDRVIEAALKDAKALCSGGVDGLIVENFGDAPFLPGRVEPQTTAFMAVILSRIAEKCDVPLGVNVLRNDGAAALGVALAGGARFVRVNVFTGAYMTDQGVIEGKAHDLLRFRKAIGSKALIFADVHVKHAAPMVGRPIEEEAADAFLRGGADGLIVTGAATGAETDEGELEKVREALPRAFLLAGSGITDENIGQALEHADAVIAGTWLKAGGDVHAPVDRKRVKRLVEAAKAR
jgi:membrane complex biogenesis BtpA family protein